MLFVIAMNLSTMVDVIFQILWHPAIHLRMLIPENSASLSIQTITWTTKNINRKQIENQHMDNKHIDNQNSDNKNIDYTNLDNPTIHNQT